jgi:hypothetical protein
VAKRDITVGSVVALTGKFLKSTGQFTSSDARKRWTVVLVDGDFISVDEPRDWKENFSAEEFETFSERDKFIVTHRRFHRGNLYVHGTLDVRNAD